MRLLTVAAVCVTVALASGCGQLTLMSDGHLGLDLGGGTADAFAIGAASHVDPVLQAFDAQQSAESDASDPNSRAGASCSGGVCAIY
jgi:hypothetical protein